MFAGWNMGTDLADFPEPTGCWMPRTNWNKYEPFCTGALFLLKRRDGIGKMKVSKDSKVMTALDGMLAHQLVCGQRPTVRNHTV